MEKEQGDGEQRAVDGSITLSRIAEFPLPHPPARKLPGLSSSLS